MWGYEIGVNLFWFCVQVNMNAWKKNEQNERNGIECMQQNSIKIINILLYPKYFYYYLTSKYIER